MDKDKEPASGKRVLTVRGCWRSFLGDIGLMLLFSIVGLANIHKGRPWDGAICACLAVLYVFRAVSDWGQYVAVKNGAVIVAPASRPTFAAGPDGPSPEGIIFVNILVITAVMATVLSAGAFVLHRARISQGWMENMAVVIGLWVFTAYCWRRAV
ncbi:MAG: hypothetical protein JO250_05960, partial [Armatimonadetes bacterium]|nr:hypothetical protein [Armatimonadota bacterium]